MANLNSIARPYALAAFECARDTKQLLEWKGFLQAAAEIASNKQVLRLLSNPEFPTAKLVVLFQEILSSQLNDERKNFLLLLAQNKRLAALPDIAASFNAYYAALEKVSAVRLVTAVDINEDFRQKITSALTKRIQRDVVLKCEVDPAILGGAIIHIGDRVIDGSIRGKLTRLLEFSLR